MDINVFIKTKLNSCSFKKIDLHKTKKSKHHISQSHISAGTMTSRQTRQTAGTAASTERHLITNRSMVFNKANLRKLSSSNSLYQHSEGKPTKSLKQAPQTPRKPHITSIAISNSRDSKQAPNERRIGISITNPEANSTPAAAKRNNYIN